MEPLSLSVSLIRRMRVTQVVAAAALVVIFGCSRNQAAPQGGQGSLHEPQRADDEALVFDGAEVQVLRLLSTAGLVPVLRHRRLR